MFDGVFRDLMVDKSSTDGVVKDVSVVQMQEGQETKHNINSLDPRPGLSQDSLLWQQLLSAAQDIDYRLFGALLCMRRTGVKLARNPSGSLRLIPHIDPTGATGWTSQAEYDSQKGEILDQVKGPLIELLGKMAA